MRELIETKLFRSVILAASIYFFLVSIRLISSAFEFLGSDFAEQLLAPTANPVVGLCIGILVTSLVQSSSVTTSIIVSMVAAGTLGLGPAIPMIMGANIGTTVTNTIVSLGHLSRKQEFRRALAGATVHDFFNVCSVLILLPIELLFHPIETIAIFLTTAFEGMGGLTFISPIKFIISPATHLITDFAAENPVALIVIGVALLFLCLKFIVSSMRAIALEKIEAFLDVYLFRSALTAFLFGLAFTAIVQSSSITTSLIIPLIGAGVLSIRKAFPYTLGANIGTTVTAFLAALALNAPVAITVALTHLVFNVFGTSIFYPLRRIPIGLAERFSGLASESKHLAILYLVIGFYLFPLILILLFGG